MGYEMVEINQSQVGLETIAVPVDPIRFQIPDLYNCQCGFPELWKCKHNPDMSGSQAPACHSGGFSASLGRGSAAKYALDHYSGKVVLPLTRICHERLRCARQG